jgi:hypothetical protein
MVNESALISGANEYISPIIIAPSNIMLRNVLKVNLRLPIFSFLMFFMVLNTFFDNSPLLININNNKNISSNIITEITLKTLKYIRKKVRHDKNPNPRVVENPTISNLLKPNFPILNKE